MIVLLGLLVNVINHFAVDFIIPITKVDENMKRSHFRDAVLSQKFWVNLNCVNNLESVQATDHSQTDFLGSREANLNGEDQYAELSVYEIFAGSTEYNYPGLYSLIYKFMEAENYPAEYRE